jgi:hypothetical protein
MTPTPTPIHHHHQVKLSEDKKKNLLQQNGQPAQAGRDGQTS